MRIIIVLIVSVILALTIFLIARSHIRTTFAREVTNEVELAKNGFSFLNALASKDGKRIHQMFNTAFQREISQEKLQEAIDRWYSGQSYKSVKTGFIHTVGLSGHITTWISFRNSPIPKFVYQYWIKTDSGWKLMWLTGILNHQDFVYGDYDTTAQQTIKQLMLEEAISDIGTEKIFPEVKLNNSVTVLRRPDRNSAKIKLPKNQVFWLTQDEIKKNYQRLGINTYFDFGMVRVMDGIALGALDIVPIFSAVPPPKIHRRRSVSMFFKKEAGDWVFAGYGSKW
jgi:hypothetical protein